jgi:hypothetical protein
MSSSGMWSRVDFMKIEVSDECSASVFTAEKTVSNVFYVSEFPSLPDFYTLKKEATSYAER